jgi:hypothetical protein
MNRLVLILTISIVLIGCRNKSFDSDTWKENHKEQFWMLSNLVESEILIGKSKDEVVGLLDTVDIKQFRHSDENWMFIIGKPGTLPTQSPVEVLDLTFKEDMVIKAEIRN